MICVYTLRWSAYHQSSTNPPAVFLFLQRLAKPSTPNPPNREIPNTLCLAKGGNSLAGEPCPHPQMYMHRDSIHTLLLPCRDSNTTTIATLTEKNSNGAHTITHGEGVDVCPPSRWLTFMMEHTRLLACANSPRHSSTHVSALSGHILPHRQLPSRAIGQCAHTWSQG